MTATAVAMVMGGPKVLEEEIQSELDLVDAANKGIPAEAAFLLVHQGRLSPAELYDLVAPRRTLERRRDLKGRLDADQSDRLIRVARILSQADEAFGNPEKAKKWLRTPNRSLHGEIPVNLLKSDVGGRLVERALGRLEFGVYS